MYLWFNLLLRKKELNLFKDAKTSTMEVSNFTAKESHESFKIFQNNYSLENLWTAASQNLQYIENFPKNYWEKTVISKIKELAILLNRLIFVKSILLEILKMYLFSFVFSTLLFYLPMSQEMVVTLLVVL